MERGAEVHRANFDCPVHELEKEIQFTTGYKELYHELEFFGTCPKCST